MDLNTPTPKWSPAGNEVDLTCLGPVERQLVATAHAATDTLLDPSASFAEQVEAAITVLDPILRIRLLAAAELIRRRLGMAPA